MTFQMGQLVNLWPAYLSSFFHHDTAVKIPGVRAGVSLILMFPQYHQGLASYIILNGVWVARLKCLNPPAFTTCDIPGSPAWAPNAAPFLLSDAGTHTIVEAA